MEDNLYYQAKVLLALLKQARINYQRLSVKPSSSWFLVRLAFITGVTLQSHFRHEYASKALLFTSKIVERNSTFFEGHVVELSIHSHSIFLKQGQYFDIDSFISCMHSREAYSRNFGKFLKGFDR